MKKCTLFVVVLLLVFSANIFAQNLDRSPVKSSPVAGNTEAMWDLLFNHNIQAFSTAGNAGLEFDGNSFWITKWSAGGASNVMLRMNKDGSKRDSFSVGGYVGASGIRDLAWDGKYIYGGLATGPNIVRIDTGTKAVVKTITTTVGAGNVRAIAWDPGRNGFWVCGFGGNIICVDTNGVTIPGATITSTLTGKYGLAYDNAPGGPYLYVWDQGAGAGTAQIIYQISLVTLANTGVTFNVSTVISDASGIAGGLCISSQIVPGKVVIAGCWQGVPDRVVGLELRTLAPPASDSVLVITNDSVLATNLAIRKADKDTLQKYLPMLVSKIRYITKDTNTVLPSLSNYGTIIVQETAFDAILARGLSNPQRTAIKTWLETGTPSAKKSLLLMGGDLGYNYDRAANPFTDTVFSRSYGGFQYVSDNAAPTGFNSVINIATGDADPILTTAGNYYPDGCRPISGGAAWQRYLNRSALDSAAGIGKVGANWVVATIFQDPRYYSTNGGAGSSDVGFKRVLKAALTFLKSNSGTVTGVTPATTIADKYSLSQNYPNPFNPTTKISFSIPANGFVTMKIFDVSGKEVMTLVNKSMTVGSYTVDFNGAALSSGVYFYRLESGNFVETKKMMLVK